MHNRSVKAYVGVTDGDWYRFLASRPAANEVNFWRPSGDARSGRPPGRAVPLQDATTRTTASSAAASTAASPGCGYPRRGSSSGKATAPRHRPDAAPDRPLPKYTRSRRRTTRSSAASSSATPASSRRPGRSPTGFRAQHRAGPELRPRRPRGRATSPNCSQRLLGAPAEVDLAAALGRPAGVRRSPPGPYRLGQQAFQAVVLDAYGRRCAITGDQDPSRAAGGAHPARCPPAANTASTTACCCAPTYTPCSTAATWPSTPDTACWSARGCGQDFGNGEQFYARAGQQITLPRRVADRPAREALEWHLDEVFLRGPRRNRAAGRRRPGPGPVG